MSTQPQSAAAKAKADAEAKKVADAEAKRAADADTDEHAGADGERRSDDGPGDTREPDAPKPGSDAPRPGAEGGQPATGVAAATAAAGQPATLEDAINRHLERHPTCHRWLAKQICIQAYPELAGLPPTRLSRQRTKQQQGA